MPVVFATNTHLDILDGMFPYFGTPKSRDLAYSDREMGMEGFHQGLALNIELPEIGGGYPELWFHMRMHAPDKSDDLSVDGTFCRFYSSGNAVVGGIDLIDGQMMAQARNGGSNVNASTRATYLTEQVQTLDIRVLADGVTSQVDLYIDGALVSSASGSGTATPDVVTRLRWVMDDSFSADAPRQGTWYFSEIIVSTTSTIGQRLATIRPNASGDLTEWGGGYEAFVNELSTKVAYTDQTGQRSSINFVNYGGATSGSVAAVLARTKARPKGAGPTDFELFVRSAGANYDTGVVHAGTSNVQGSFQDIWTTNPATGAAWTFAQVNNLELGVKS